MKTLRTAVVGVGYLGQFHAEKYAMQPDVELAGVVDQDPSRADLVARKVNTRAYADASQLLGKVDAVSIVVPTVHHHQEARQFLEAGVHVLLEKPMTVTVEQADELIELAARKQAVLQVGHIERFNPAVTAIRPPTRVRVRSGTEAPENAYASVPYEGHWYWIDNADLPSKRTFTFLLILFSLAETGQAPGAPVVTVPSR